MRRWIISEKGVFLVGEPLKLKETRKSVRLVRLLALGQLREALGTMMRHRFLTACTLAILPVIPVWAVEPISYDRQIAPILSRACFQCHGPDEAARKAKLRLDVHEDAIADHDVHVPVVPGSPDTSEVFLRITSNDPDAVMPPPKSGEKLTPEQIELIRAWIEQGAKRTTHWGFVPPKRPAMLQVDNSGWAINPIDNFVLERLDREGLKPSPAAGRETLLRRLSLDITGLLPSLDEIDRVVSDTRPDWYEAAVERALNSPHFGERWAREWMDASQYADSDGFEKDKPRDVWAWRDWLIQSFNENKPYDQFVVEQVAGDMLPNATQAQRVATGFLRNSMINEEGGIDPEQFRMEAQFNRVDIIGRAVLGLTVQCAQCHTHKYDPITHTEYYQMLAFLNNSYEACESVFSPEELKQKDLIRSLIGEIKNNIKAENPDWASRMAKWESTLKVLPQPTWETMALTFDDSSAGGQKCLPIGDGSYLAQGYAPTQFHPKMTAKTTLTRITAVKIELLPDYNLPRGGPGRSVYGTAALSEFELRIAPDGKPIAEYDAWTLAKNGSAIADVNPGPRKLGNEFPDRQNRQRITGPAEFAIDAKPETAWTTDVDPERRNQARYLIVKLAEPLVVEPGSTLAFRLSQLHGGWNSDDNQNYNIGRFRVSVTDSERLPDQAPSQALLQAIALEPAARTPEQADLVFEAWCATLPMLASTMARIDTLWQSMPSGTTQLVLRERETPRETHRLDRGNFLTPAESVKPGVPTFLHALNTKDTAPNRLDFARWLVSRDAPTTSRALVNRLWQQYFGQGLTTTPSDLGTQGDLPSHPELLDWLAVDFMDSGWDMKRLHRMIVTSATYRQASNVTPELLERDPYNRLVARGSRFRIDGELVRDVALTASGLLNPAIGGPSVYPPAPDFLFQPPASYGPKIWRIEDGVNKYRRGLYTFRFRSVPHPALQTFDTPAGDAPCTRRVRSNTPLQALTTLNEPLFFDCARGLAEQTLTEGGVDDRARLVYAFRRCVSRQPEDAELAALESFLQKQQTRIAAGELTPDTILASAGGDGDYGLVDRAQLAAWTLTARVILNLDETITRQ